MHVGPNVSGTLVVLPPEARGGESAVIRLLLSVLCAVSYSGYYITFSYISSEAKAPDRGLALNNTTFGSVTQPL